MSESGKKNILAERTLMERRRFLGHSAAAGLAAGATAASADRVRGANRRVRLALIGCGGRGRNVARHMNALDGVEYVATCDVYATNADRARQELNPGADTYRDFRRVLEREDIDAVHIATPDHWHAIPVVLACQAGKHVYVEKPLSHNIAEGQAMVRAARASRRVVLTGTQQRSAPHFAELAELVRNGPIRDVRFVRVWNFANLAPDGIGTVPDSEPPSDLDWDFYLGPAPRVPFNHKRFLGTYRHFTDYAGGRITDYGVHRFDTVHQIMGEDRPLTISASGGRRVVKGMGDQPDLLQVTYEYPGFVLSYEACEFNAHGLGGRSTAGMSYYGASGQENRPNGMAFYGSNGAIFADRIGYEIIPEDKAASGEPGLKRRHRNVTRSTHLHAAHFIRCIRDGEQPRSDCQVGHRSTNIAHLGNIALRTGHKLRWDGEREDFIGDPEASKMLARQARKPWDLI